MKLLASYLNLADASSYYRGSGVFGEMHREDLDIIESEAIHWTCLKKAEKYFIQRPFMSRHVEAIESAQNLNRKVIIDYDDLLIDIPNHFEFLKKLKKNNNITKYDIGENVIKCLNLADLVIASTEHLKAELKLYNDNIIVINNCFDDFSYELPKCRNSSRNRKREKINIKSNKWRKR